jgi:DNA-binding CsgD family transcriptional regulator
MFDNLSQQDEDEMCAFSLMEHLGQQKDSTLNPAEAVLHNLHWCSAIVCANGFEGLLFDNPTWNYIPEIVAALDKFGAANCAELLRKGVAAFPTRLAAANHKEIERLRLALTPAERKLLEQLSKSFSIANDEEINSKTLLTYIQQNKEAIRFSVSLDRKLGKFRLSCRDKTIKLKR